MRISASLLVLLAASAAPAADPTYWQDVRPILRKHCTVCHNPRNRAEVEVSGGLVLDTYQAVLAWKEKKIDLVKPGKSGDSPLYKILFTDDEEKRMPLGGKRLPDEKLAVLKRWIDTGAKEGTKPDDDKPVVPVRPKTRKRDVILPTTSTPAFDKLPRGPLALALKVGPLSPVAALAFHPDGKWLAEGAYGRVTIWDVTKALPVRVLSNVLAAVNDLRFSPDGKLLAVAGGQPSAKGDLRLFTTADWKLKVVLGGHEDVVNSIAFDRDGKRLLSASYDRTARIWDVSSGKSLRTLTMHSDFVLAAAFSPDGKHVYTGSKDHSVRMTEAESGKGVFTFSDRSEDVLSVAAHPDGKSVVVAGIEPGLTWWNVQTGEKVRTVGGHRGAVYEVAFSRDGKRLVSAGSDGTAKVFNGVTGALERSVTVGSLCYAVAISPDGKRMATGSFDGLTRLYDAGTGTHLGTLLSLPAEGEKNDWLALSPMGYAAGSESLLKMGRWTIANREAPAATVWKALHKPELAAKALRGEAVAAPEFGK
jgi:DNA-binding beta-propeller fold protein YncE